MKSVSSSEHGAVKIILTIIIVVLLLAGGAGYYLWQDQVKNLNSQVTTLEGQATDLNNQLETSKQTAGLYTSINGVSMFVYTPLEDSTVKSGEWILGQVPGDWSFEGSFPVVLKNSKGETVANGTAKLLDDWMTTKLVPFSLQLGWSTDQTGVGSLILQKDNPSGLSSNDDSVVIQVKF